MRRKKIFGCYTNQTIKSCGCQDCRERLAYLMMNYEDSIKHWTAKERENELRLHRFGFLKPKSYKLEKVFYKKHHKRKSKKKWKFKRCEYLIDKKLDKEMMENELRDSLFLYSLQSIKKNMMA